MTGDNQQAQLDAATHPELVGASEASPRHFDTRLVINVFIVVFFLIAAIEMLPPNVGKQFESLYKPVLTDFLQMSQHWAMFGKSDQGYATINDHVVVVFRYADGSTRLEEFYRLDKRGQIERWQHGKMLLPLYPLRNDDPVSPYHPSLERYLARAYNDPANPVVEVKTTINWSRIPPMDQFTNKSDLPPDNIHGLIYIYKVSPDDLK